MVWLHIYSRVSQYYYWINKMPPPQHLTVHPYLKRDSCLLFYTVAWFTHSLDLPVRGLMINWPRIAWWRLQTDALVRKAWTTSPTSHWSLMPHSPFLINSPNFTPFAQSLCRVLIFDRRGEVIHAIYIQLRRKKTIWGLWDQTFSMYFVCECSSVLRVMYGLSTCVVHINSYSASHDNWCTGTLLNRVITVQWEGMGDVGVARYEPALLPPCPTIKVLSYSNYQRSTHSSSRAWQFKC